MRFSSLALAGLLLASAASACPEEEGSALERAERMEKEAKALLEHGKKAEGARLMAKAWAARAEAWGADARKADEVHGAALSDLRHKLADLKERAAELEQAAKAAADAGRPDEAERKRAESQRAARAVEELSEDLKAHPWKLLNEPGSEPGFEHLRARAAELRARSEALERAGKEARAAGDEAAAQEKMAASGRAWKEAEELARAAEGGDLQHATVRLKRAKLQAQLEAAQRTRELMANGHVPGGEAAQEELAAQVEVFRAEIAALDRGARKAKGPKGEHGRHDLAEDLGRLRAEVRELREAVGALRRALGEKTEQR